MIAGGTAGGTNRHGDGARILDDEVTASGFVRGEVVDFQAVDGGGEFDGGRTFVDQARERSVAIKGEFNAGVFQHARGEGCGRLAGGRARTGSQLEDFVSEGRQLAGKNAQVLSAQESDELMRSVGGVRQVVHVYVFRAVVG
jgi:hypothetical protein